MYFARHFARMGMAERAVQCLKSAMAAGFVCAPETLRADAWLGAVRGHARFNSILAAAEKAAEQARKNLGGFAQSRGAARHGDLRSYSAHFGARNTFALIEITNSPRRELDRKCTVIVNYNSSEVVLQVHPASRLRLESQQKQTS